VLIGRDADRHEPGRTCSADTGRGSRLFARPSTDTDSPAPGRFGTRRQDWPAMARAQSGSRRLFHPCGRSNDRERLCPSSGLVLCGPGASRIVSRGREGTRRGTLSRGFRTDVTYPQAGSREDSPFAPVTTSAPMASAPVTASSNDNARFAARARSNVAAGTVSRVLAAIRS
jgi:hypothetical protein